MRWAIRLECEGSHESVVAGHIDRQGALQAGTFGMSLIEAKRILHGLQQAVVQRQLGAHVETQRPCERCARRRRLKDYHTAQFQTLFGEVALRIPPITSLWLSRRDCCHPHVGRRRSRRLDFTGTAVRTKRTGGDAALRPTRALPRCWDYSCLSAVALRLKRYYGASKPRLRGWMPSSRDTLVIGIHTRSDGVRLRSDRHWLGQRVRSPLPCACGAKLRDRGRTNFRPPFPAAHGRIRAQAANHGPGPPPHAAMYERAQSQHRYHRFQ